MAILPVLQHLMDMDVHLPQERRRYRIPIAFIGKNGHSALIAEGLQEGLGDAVGETIERAQQQDAVESFMLGLAAPSPRWE